MDTLFVSTQDAGHEFVTTWRWQPNTATAPSLGGTIDVTLGERYTEDRRIPAELGAIHHQETRGHRGRSRPILDHGLRTMERLIRRAKRIEDIPQKEWQRIVRKYGAVTMVLHNKDAACLFILKREPYGLVMATVRRRNRGHDRIMPTLPRLVGGRVVYPTT